MSTKGECAVELKGVAKKIKNRSIVEDLNLQIHYGEVYGLLGPNGAGKTTTMRVMLNLVKQSAGEVLIDGLSNKTNYKKNIRKIGAIIENPEFYRYLSGYNNLLHYARMYGDIDKNQIDEAVITVGLEDRIHDKVSKYSLGMKQRLGIAQALVHNPRILILDEPTNGLDPSGILELRNNLKALAHDKGIAVIVSSHLLSEMELMCDRAAIINKGKLVEVVELSKMKEIGGLKAIQFRVEANEQLKKFLDNSTVDKKYKYENDVLIFTLRDDEIADINKLLVINGINVTRIQEWEESLECMYMDMMGV